jgi:predicted nucleic acid-binding protein
MTVISNSSPLIALSRIDKLTLFRDLFKTICIPDAVFQETVLQSRFSIQKENILKAIDDAFIVVETPETERSFRRTIDPGERGVLNLALDKAAELLIIDDKKARNEAIELGFRVINTSTLLRRAEQMKLISSYENAASELEKSRIYLPK